MIGETPEWIFWVMVGLLIVIMCCRGSNANGLIDACPRRWLVAVPTVLATGEAYLVRRYLAKGAVLRLVVPEFHHRGATSPNTKREDSDSRWTMIQTRCGFPGCLGRSSPVCPQTAVCKGSLGHSKGKI